MYFCILKGVLNILVSLPIEVSIEGFEKLICIFKRNCKGKGILGKKNFKKNEAQVQIIFSLKMNFSILLSYKFS